MFTVIKNFLFSIMFLVFTMPLVSENDPHVFIDDNAQLMITVLIENQALFLEDREEYEQKIKDIFEPMIDFKRVAASVMGKKYYLASTPDQRNEFVDVFKDSLLDTYAETLAQWENQKIVTVFPNDVLVLDNLKNIENSKYLASSINVLRNSNGELVSVVKTEASKFLPYPITDQFLDTLLIVKEGIISERNIQMRQIPVDYDYQNCISEMYDVTGYTQQ